MNAIFALGNRASADEIRARRRWVWIAWRRLALEAERSCDDAVLRRSEAAAYADQLVEPV
jgi:hypothetical protein